MELYLTFTQLLFMVIIFSLISFFLFYVEENSAKKDFNKNKFKIFCIFYFVGVFIGFTIIFILVNNNTINIYQEELNQKTEIIIDKNKNKCKEFKLLTNDKTNQYLIILCDDKLKKITY